MYCGTRDVSNLFITVALVLAEAMDKFPILNE